MQTESTTLNISEGYIGSWHGVFDSGRNSKPSYPSEIVITGSGVLSYYKQRLIKTWGELTPREGVDGALLFDENTYKMDKGRKILCTSGTLRLTLNEDGNRLGCLWSMPGQSGTAKMERTNGQSDFVSEIKVAISLIDE